YPIAYIDPVGDWRIEIPATDPVYVHIDPTTDSGVLVLAITSPASGHYKRIQTIPITIRVTKNNQPVSNALVVIWDIPGERRILTEQTDGTYTLEYAIPASARTGRWAIYATAQAIVSNQHLGGQYQQPIEIDETALQLEIVRPIYPQYNIGDTVEIELRPSYTLQQSPEHVTFHATLGTHALAFQKTNSNTYTATFPITPDTERNLVLDVTATDDYNNTGHLTRTLGISGTTDYYLQQYGLGAIVAVILFLTALHVLLSTHKKANKIKALVREQQELADAEKTVQEKYFKLQSIDDTTFERETSRIQQKKAGLEERQRQLGQKK
ncbi:MAG: hypothetical protein Q7R47_00155, partial [Candidatus Diapherotrites archaeon]|nr:hypothetical protein [Candidatus Diapherotrites archaeon]